MNTKEYRKPLVDGSTRSGTYRSRVVVLSDGADRSERLMGHLEGALPEAVVVSVASRKALEDALGVGQPDLVVTDGEIGADRTLPLMEVVRTVAPACPNLLIGGETRLVELALSRGLTEHLLDSAAAPTCFPLLAGHLLAERATGSLPLPAVLSYRHLFDGAPFGIYRSSPDGMVREVNATLADLLGYPSSEAMTGLAAEDLYADSDDRSLWLEQPEAKGEVRLRRADGDLVWVLESTLDVRDSNGVIERVGIVVDISERRQAQDELRESSERFRAVVENVDEVILIVSAAGIIRYTSPAATRTLGFDPPDVEGSQILDFVHRDDRKALRDSFARTLATGEAISPLEHRACHADGSWKWMEVTGSALASASLSDGVIVLVSREVTHRRMLHERISRLQRFETLTRLVGGLAHEVNNALAAVVGNAELLELRHGDDAETMEDLEEVKLNARRATDLIRELRATASRPVVDPIHLHLDRWVAEVESAVRRAVGDKVSLVIDCDPGIGVVEADPRQLERVLMILVSNAVEATDDRGTVRIALANREVGPQPGTGKFDGVAGSFVMLSVTDDGHGMNEAVRSRALEPFFTTKLDDPGAGLGLTTAHHIARQCGGFLNLDTAVGQGTQVTLFLPRVEDDPAEEPVTSSDLDPGGSRTVLVVDDDSAVLRVATRLLRAHGYSVLEAGGAAAALRLAAEFEAPIDLLLTDVVMPETSGIELAQQLMIVRPEIRVVFMSGYSDDVQRKHGGLPDGTTMVAKPFSAGALVNGVHRAFHRS